MASSDIQYGKFEQVVDLIARDADYKSCQEAADFMAKNPSAFDSRKELEKLSAKLAEEGVLGRVVFCGLIDELEALPEYGTNGENEFSKEELLQLAESESSDPLTRLAAAAAASKMNSDDTLTAEKLQEMEESRIAENLMDMFPNENAWRKLAGRDGNVDKEELIDSIQNGNWSDRERETLEGLLYNFDTFSYWGSVSYHNAQEEIDDSEDYALDFGDAPINDVNHEKEKDSKNENAEEKDKETDNDKDKDHDYEDIDVMSTKELVDVLEDGDAEVERKLAVIEQLAKNGVKEITLKDEDGKEIRCQVVVEPVAPGSKRNYVHLFAFDDSGNRNIVLRAIGKDGEYQKERDKSENEVSFVGSWWSKKYPDGAISE